MMSWEDYKAAHPRRDKWAWKRDMKKEMKKEGEKVDIGGHAEKIVEDVKKMVAPKQEPKAPTKIDFNVEVDAVVRSCDENRSKVDRVQDIITDRAVPDEALLLLEEIHIALGNLKLLTRKMAESYKAADDGIAVLEKEATEVFKTKKKLAEIRATRKKEVE